MSRNQSRVTLIRGVWDRLPPPLVIALGGAAAALSWDALRAVAVTTGAVHHQVMAGVWAITIDLQWIACMRAATRARPGRGGWAVCGLAVGVVFSGFQVVTPPTWLARMVPVVALLVAWLLETYVVVNPRTTVPAAPDPAGLHPMMESVDELPGLAYPSRLAYDARGAPRASAAGGDDPAGDAAAAACRPAAVPGAVPDVAAEGLPPAAAESQRGDRPDASGDGRRVRGESRPEAGGSADPRDEFPPARVPPGVTRPMTVSEAVSHLITKGVIDLTSVRPRDVMGDVRRLTAPLDPALSTVGKELSVARSKARSNGGVKVRQ